MGVMGYAVRKNPVEVIFPVTYRCNSNCLMCDRVKLADTVREMDLATIKAVFSDLRAFGISRVNLTGGEPFLRKDIHEILGFLTGTGFTVTLTTNGTLLSEEAIRKVVCNKKIKMIISLDTLKRSLYRKLRGVDMLERVMENIMLVKRIAPQYRLRVHMVVSSLNCGELDDVIEFCRKNSLVFSAAPYNYFSPLERKNKEMAYDKERDCITQAFRKLAALSRKSHVSGFSVFYSKAVDWVEGKPIGRCNAGYETIFLNVDGKVAACGSMKPFGDLTRDKIRDVWNPQKIRKPVLMCCQRPACYVGCYWGFSLLKRNKLSVVGDFTRSPKKLFSVISGKEY